MRLTGQTFTRAADLVGFWNYHEVTPSNQLNAGDADWTRGPIFFHPGGCSAADLFFADGTRRAEIDRSRASHFQLTRLHRGGVPPHE